VCLSQRQRLWSSLACYQHCVSRSRLLAFHCPALVPDKCRNTMILCSVQLYRTILHTQDYKYLRSKLTSVAAGRRIPVLVSKLVLGQHREAATISRNHCARTVGGGAAASDMNVKALELHAVHRCACNMGKGPKRHKGCPRTKHKCRNLNACAGP
jgi:hypothetical protein